MKNTELENDEIFIEFIEDRKNISKDRIKNYVTSLTQFFTVVNQTPAQYIKEVKDNQISFIRKTEIINEKGEKETIQQIIEPDIQKGKLYKDFKEFRKFEKSKKISDRTIYEYMGNVRTFLSKQGIKLPEKISIDWVINSKKPLKHEKIKRAIAKADIRDKALFSFMTSCGMRSKDVRFLKIGQLLKSLELENIDDLFKLDDNRIPYFEFIPSKTKKRGFHCKTCSTPESVKLIIKYLLDRNENEELKTDSYLFITRHGTQISGTGFRQIFKRMNQKLYSDDTAWFRNQYKIGKISEEKYLEEINDISKFHAHALRAFFINTISSHCNNLKVVAAMEGHKSPIDTDISYTNFDRGVIVNHYFPIIPYLSFEKTDVEVLTEERIKEYEKKLDAMSKVAEEANERAEKAEKFIIEFEENYGDVIEEKNKEENYNIHCIEIEDDERCSFILDEILKENPDINIWNNYKLIEAIYQLITNKEYPNLSGFEVKKEINKLINKFKSIKRNISDFYSKI